jgi:uncharacterized protein (UPF0303 family)
MISELKEEFAGLVLARFTEADALALGQILLQLAVDKPVVIQIRNANRVFFHAALPGSGPMHDVWARRKGNTALFFQKPSLLVGKSFGQTGETMALHGLDMADYIDHGGAVPIQVEGVGVVAVVAVSGLPSLEDHQLAVAGLRRLMQIGESG